MRPIMFVAEISANHQGNLDRALTLVDAAAESGATHVKFQTWMPGTMVKKRGHVLEDGPWKGMDLVDLYAEAWLPFDWHKPLFQRAADLGIEAFSTPFDTDALYFLEGLGCPRFKVASFSIINLPLIRAIAKTGKPMIISTGMATEEEINAALEASNFADVTLLKCTSAYPAEAQDANLATMVDLANHYAPAGLSDHTLGIGVAVAAAALGATVIEKHLTLLRADGGPDAAFSMEPDEFSSMVKACRQAAAAIGTVRYGPSESEMPMLEVRRARNQG